MVEEVADQSGILSGWSRMQFFAGFGNVKTSVSDNLLELDSIKKIKYYKKLWISG
jgi:hypothetical protein